jgi:four helix bundle protein
MHNYKELIIWKRAIKLAVEVYKISASLPIAERHRLTSQIKRAVVSIASIIAEGAGRNTDGEFVQFHGIANGPSFEIATQLIISGELGLLKEEQVSGIINESDEIQKMLYTFMNNQSNNKRK